MTSNEQEKDILIRGNVKRITFQTNDTGFVVARVQVEGEQELVTLTGNRLNLSIGENIVARGHYSEHPKFGTQFLAYNVEHVLPTTTAGLTKYLGSGLISGIGEKTAARIVKHFGKDVLDILRNSPQRLAEVPKISKKKAIELAEFLVSKNERSEIDRFFSEYDIQPALVNKIYQKFGIRSIEIVKNNPYSLAYHIKGIGFITADEIALKLGLSRSSPQRLQSGLFYALEKAKEDGHCFLSYQDLQSKAERLLDLDFSSNDLHPYLEQLSIANLITIEDDNIYLKSLYSAEESVANFLAFRTRPHITPLLSAEQQQDAIKCAEKALKISLSKEQCEAVSLAATYPLLAITGGPGCGKTTVIKALSTLFIKNHKILALAAPTGKAAQRMSQVCGVPACTIHRLLGYDPIKNAFHYGLNEPLCIAINEDEDPKQVDAVIVDEASMIDISLAKALFSSIPQNATLILVGDKDQLPSVGPGRLFADILSCPEIKSVELTHLYRRDEESNISVIAHDVNSGTIPQIPTLGGAMSDAYFVEINNPEQIVSYVLKLVTRQIPKYRNIPPKEISVLTPSNVGLLGTIELNKQLQAAINPERQDGKYLTVGDKEFRLGDKVCQRVNNYKIDLNGVFNGDSGIIREIDRIEQSLVVELWDGRFIKYQGKNIDQLSLAYAITVHRSQGSELPCAIMILHDSQYILLERQLIYTGITRAKGLLFIVGTQKAIRTAVNKTSVIHRQTNLYQRFQAALKIIPNLFPS